MKELKMVLTQKCKVCACVFACVFFREEVKGAMTMSIFVGL